MSMKKATVHEWIRQYGKYVVCFAGGLVLYLLAESLRQEMNSVDNGILYRNPCGQGDASYSISVNGLEEPFSVELSVPERELSEEEFFASVPEMAELLMKRIVGENTSLQEVCTELE